MSNNLYNVGDVVTIRSDLSAQHSYDGVSVTSGMQSMSGCRVTIESIETYTYRIKEYTNYWNDEMFESIPIAENDDKSRIDDREASADVSIKDLFDLYKQG